MKKTMAVLIALITVLLSFPISTSAAQTNIEEIILSEIQQLVDMDDYPKNTADKGVYLLTLVEHGYTQDGFVDGNTLYFYLYNPSCKDISSTGLNYVQMAVGWDEKGMPSRFGKYGLVIEGAALDGLYIRAKLKVKAKSLANISGGVRRYGVTEIELQEDAAYDAESYSVGYSFAFKGYGNTLTCERSSYLTLKLDVGHTSYLTGDSVLGKGYSNQVSSVYFSVPREIEEKYGALYNIEYEYYKYRTSPMLVTTNEEFYNEMLKCVGKTADKDDWPIGIQASIADAMSGSTFYFHYGHMNWLDDIAYDPTCDLLSTVFLSSTLDAGETLISSEEMTDYFQGYKSSVTTEKVRGYSVDLFDMTQYTAKDHYVLEKKTRDDVFDMDSFADTHNWFQGVFNYGLFYDKDKHDETIANAKFIQPVSSADFVADDFSKQFLVSKNDVVSLARYCQEAERNNENVYLLRFATSDCYTQNVMKLNAFGKQPVNNLKAWYNDPSGKRVSTTDLAFIEEDVYLDFDIITLGFSDDGKDITTLGVVMSPTDIIPELDGIQTGGDAPPTVDDWKDMARKIAGIAMIVAVALLIIWFVGKLGKVEELRTNREIRKHLKDQNRNDRK